MKTRTFLKLASIILAAAGLASCSGDRDEVAENGAGFSLKDSYSVSRFTVLSIQAEVSGATGYTWSVGDSLISENQTLEFISPYAKSYPVTLKVQTAVGTKSYKTDITVGREAKTFSRYISKVLEFRPAVGQFINELPEYSKGNSAADMLQKANASLVGGNSTMISLGGYGGYVVFGFDHTIPNMGGRDFKVLGNALWASAAQQQRTGSCEPGIIMVAYDKNKNGKPDEDEWYEIAGSEYFKNSTIKNYSISYTKPDENKAPVPGSAAWQADVQYISWKDNQGAGGYKTKNGFHSQSYYPLWISEAVLSFTGTKLADNYADESGSETYWVGKSYEFGYADNAPNNDEASNIDISWAVDKNGRYVRLPGIDFVKVYTGTNQEAGWLGEVSTEVAGAYDLYLK